MNIKTVKITKKFNEDFANEIRDFLIKNGLWSSVRIYFNGKAYCSAESCGSGSYGFCRVSGNCDKSKSSAYGVISNISPSDYVEYGGNTDSIVMTFEGTLYDILNYHSGLKLYEEFEKLFTKRGMYFEFGHAWSLTACY